MTKETNCEFVLGAYVGTKAKGKRRSKRHFGVFQDGKQAIAKAQEIATSGLRYADMTIEVYDNNDLQAAPIELQGKHIREVIAGVGDNTELQSTVRYGYFDSENVLQLHDSNFVPNAEVALVAITYRHDFNDAGDMVIESINAAVVGAVAIQREVAYRESVATAMRLLSAG